MRKIILILLAVGFALSTSTAASAGEAEFAIVREDQDHDGTPDLFIGEIDVEVATATKVEISRDDGANWQEFEGDAGSFWFDVEADTLAELGNEASGTHLLKITHGGISPSTYRFAISNDEAAIAARFPDPIPEITSITWNANTATMSWDWAGGPSQVDGLGVEVEGCVGGNWVMICDKSSGDPPPDHIEKDIHMVDDIVFPNPPGMYDALEFLVGYANGAYVRYVDGTLVSGWTHLSGQDVFTGSEDVFELFISSDEVPEPASAALLALGALALLRRRRKTE